MKVSQIETFSDKESVNKWLRLNHHLEIISVAISKSDYSRVYLVHYKINAKVESL